MNSTLLKNAVALVPETELLVNMVRLRVRQLVNGHRALILAPPGMGFADIALSEIAAGKLTSEPSLDPVAKATAPVVVPFPKTVPTKKAA
jgi:DNA-directed RNA polymerase subunit K/omega